MFRIRNIEYNESESFMAIATEDDPDALTLLAPSYQKLHIASAPSNFSIIASF